MEPRWQCNLAQVLKIDLKPQPPSLQNRLQLNTKGLHLAFNSKSFKKMYQISQPHPGPDGIIQ